MKASRTGLGAGRDGFVHEALIYGSDEELVGAAVPFLQGGLAAGEPTLLGVGPRQRDLILAELGPASGITLLEPSHYNRPYEALRINRKLYGDLVDRGAAQIRVIGSPPSTRSTWHGWVRYEAAINHLMREFPIWGICPYDERSTPDEVLADVERTHPHLVGAGAVHSRNPRFADPEMFLATRASDDLDPLMRGPAHLELDDPEPVEARRGVLDLAAGTALSDEKQDSLALAVCELVTNAIEHGAPPIRLRAWRAPDRVVAAVSDAGTGPDDVFAGFVPGHDGEPDALGLHIAYQVADEVTMTYSATEFTVHVVVRA